MVVGNGHPQNSRNDGAGGMMGSHAAAAAAAAAAANGAAGPLSGAPNLGLHASPMGHAPGVPSPARFAPPQQSPQTSTGGASGMNRSPPPLPLTVAPGFPAAGGTFPNAAAHLGQAPTAPQMASQNQDHRQRLNEMLQFQQQQHHQPMPGQMPTSLTAQQQQQQQQLFQRRALPKQQRQAVGASPTQQRTLSVQQQQNLEMFMSQNLHPNQLLQQQQQNSMRQHHQQHPQETQQFNHFQQQQLSMPKNQLETKQTSKRNTASSIRAIKSVQGMAAKLAGGQGQTEKAKEKLPVPTPAPVSSAMKRSATGVYSDVVSPLNHEEAQALLSQCGWADKVIVVSKLFLGGEEFNGFVRATKEAIKIKKKRARQAKSQRNRQMQQAAASDAASLDDWSLKADALGRKEGGISTAKRPLPTSSGVADPRGLLQNEAGDIHAMMTSAMAEELRTELTSGIVFCEQLMSAMKSILLEIDPEGLADWNARHNQQAQAGKNELTGATGLDAMEFLSAAAVENFDPTARLKQDEADNSMILGESVDVAMSPMSASLSSAPFPTHPRQQEDQTMNVPEEGDNAVLEDGLYDPDAETVEEGNPNGSTLRKFRKRSSEVMAELKQLELAALASAGGMGDDNDGVRSNKKRPISKELAVRMFENDRFRSLKTHDYVAARVANHEHWILARVVKDWVAPDTSHVDIASLSEAKRDALFKEKVMVRDHEEFTDGGDESLKPQVVARPFVLPLPRNRNEATLWGGRYKKQMRVYAMFPQTTTFYSGTVVDNTTYCRGEDDIIVVEFDDDEDDQKKTTPHRHIPARFVSLVPKESHASIRRKRRNPHGTDNSSSSSSPLKQQQQQTPAPVPPPPPPPSAMAEAFASLSDVTKGRSTKSEATTTTTTTHHNRSDSADSTFNDLINQMESGGGFDDGLNFDFTFDTDLVDGKDPELIATATEKTTPTPTPAPAPASASPATKLSLRKKKSTVTHDPCVSATGTTMAAPTPAKTKEKGAKVRGTAVAAATAVAAEAQPRGSRKTKGGGTASGRSRRSKRSSAEDAANTLKK